MIFDLSIAELAGALTALVAAAAGLAVFMARPAYAPAALMTGNELEFFGRLTRALPEYLIFPQVAMAALMKPCRSGHRGKRDFHRIAAKRVDWVICTRKGARVVAIVELDDRTHSRRVDAARDAMTRSAGIPTLRFESRKKPSEEQIRRAVEDVRLR